MEETMTHLGSKPSNTQSSSLIPRRISRTRSADTAIFFSCVSSFRFFHSAVKSSPLRRMLGWYRPHPRKALRERKILINNKEEEEKSTFTAHWIICSNFFLSNFVRGNQKKIRVFLFVTESIRDENSHHASRGDFTIRFLTGSVHWPFSLHLPRWILPSRPSSSCPSQRRPRKSFRLTHLVDVVQPFLRIGPAARQGFLHLRMVLSIMKVKQVRRRLARITARKKTYWIDEQFGAVVAHASHHFHRLRQKADVKYGFRQIDVPEMTWKIFLKKHEILRSQKEVEKQGGATEKVGTLFPEI